jgi:hypothetical protein
MTTNVSPKWRRIQSAPLTVPLHRKGWRGVYDAIVAAVTRTPRRTAPEEYVATVWVQGEAGVSITIRSLYVERATDEVVGPR